MFNLIGNHPIFPCPAAWGTHKHERMSGFFKPWPTMYILEEIRICSVIWIQLHVSHNLVCINRNFKPSEFELLRFYCTLFKTFTRVHLLRLTSLCMFFLWQTYEIRVSQQRMDQAIVSVVFTNLTSHNIKNLEFNVMDTLNTKLQRGVSGNVLYLVPLNMVLCPPLIFSSFIDFCMVQHGLRSGYLLSVKL